MTNLLNSPSVQHLIVALATIGALAALAATGTISGSDALGPIVAIGGVGVGITGSNLISATSSTPPPAPAAAATPAPKPVAAAPPAA